MIAAFSRAIALTVAPESVGMVEIDVRDRRDTAVPGVGRVESPAEPDLDQGEIDRRLGEPAEGHGGQQLEFRRRPRAARDPGRRVEDLTDEPRERPRVDEPAIDLEPLAIAHEVWLGRLRDAVAGGLQGGPGQGEDAALAVRPCDECAPERQLGVAELGEERLRPAQPQMDAESATILEGPERLLVGEVAHVTPGTARPRRRRTG